MAIIVRNKSLCPICGQTIKEGDEIVAFPAIVTNKRDRLYQLNDSAFHYDCFEHYDLAKEAKELFNFWKKKTKVRECHVCKKQITDPDDYYSFPFLGWNLDLLSEINYSQFHKSCLSKWSKIEQVIQHIEEMIKRGVWDEDFHSKLLRELQEIANGKI